VDPRGFPTLEHRLRIHCRKLATSYSDDLEAAMAVACIHNGHESAADSWACFTAVVLSEFLRDPRNRAVALAAIVAAQEAA